MPSPSAVQQPVALYDARPFFEKALQYGLQHGIISSATTDAICTDAPKGMVQIARYFGNEFLRPDLEKARERLVNLVSLYLESSCEGDLQRAAQSLQSHSFLSRSKGGSDMLKALIAMPQNSHFGMQDGHAVPGRFTDDQIPQLARWSLRSLADYQAELARRQQAGQVLDAAHWLARQGGVEAEDLHDAGSDAEAVIRTALLLQAAGRTRMPDWAGFEKMVLTLRERHQAAPLTDVPKPKHLPSEMTAVVDEVRRTVAGDLSKMLDPALAVKPLFVRSPAFVGRYFWREDPLQEISDMDTQVSKAWEKATRGAMDEGALLTLFLGVSAGVAPKTLLTETAAKALIRKIQKSGFNPQLVRDYIRAHAPVQYQTDYARLWESFADEARPLLRSDAVFAMDQALALLHRECRIK